jgi:hypothetical protein
MKNTRAAIVVIAGIVALASGLLGAPAASADDPSGYTTDAALCRQIGNLPYAPGDQSYTRWGIVEIPGVGTRTNFACGGGIRLDKPPVPRDGTSVTVNTALGQVSIPCQLDATVNPFTGGKQWGYIGLPNDAFSDTGSGDWQFMKERWEAQQRADYINGGVFTATKVGTFNFVGEFPDTLYGGVVKCNATVNVTAAAPTAKPAVSAKCTAAKKALAKAKAQGTKKQVAAARKRVAAACAS